jgi:hypothetical protein
MHFKLLLFFPFWSHNIISFDAVNECLRELTLISL